MHPKLKYFSEKYPANGERGSAVDDEKIDATLEQVDVKEGAEVKFFPQFTGPISIKACGEGISLVGASRIIILDARLNPSVTRQAIGRAFRQGRKMKVYVYRLIACRFTQTNKTT
ncbi:hypothetical protein Peur_073460 [Populus x canadensis]